MGKFLRVLAVLLIGLGQVAVAQNIVTITDADLQANQTFTMTSNNTYLLDGYVYLEEGGRLIIEPGTVIKGKTVPTTSDQTSALIIAKGAQIFAEGTADAPIIFTGEIDDLTTCEDLAPTDSQTWGGLIILGNAPIGEDGGTDVIEGIPSDEPRIVYGGNDPNDNSGILTYVSVRHGGSVLGADNEINGITLGGVGRGTTIDYVEVYGNEDDGIEIFGGTVNITHAVVSFVGDDSFDFDESWDGYMQFLFSIKGGGRGDHAIEYDGSEATDLQPKTVGRIYNGTFIGDPANSSTDGARFRNDAAFELWNSIFTEIPGYAVRVDGTSCNRLQAGESSFFNNIFTSYGTLAAGDCVTATSQALTFGNSEINTNNPQLAGISRMANGGLDPRPEAGSTALVGAAVPTEAGVVPVPYRGAFSNVDNWAAGWTALSQCGFFGDIATVDNVINDERIEAGQTLTLTNDQEYLLDGYVYVEEGATLIIEAGTVIKGKTVPTNGDLTSALIIARGGQIFAEGTADAPIIFTSELDDLSTTTDLTAADNQTWGGLIILGNAPIGEDGGTDVIEGIPSDEPRIVYGGDEPMDNSGVIRYVSLRHGGSVLGADNEINGLTCGGVGAGTTIDFIEVFASKDDGIELFGGTVNVEHAVIGFVGDDGFDVDESWAGYGQFIFGLQGEGIGDHGIEYDGSEATNLEPKTTGRIYNATFIGEPANSSSDGSRFRQDAAVQVWNSIFTEVAGYAYRFDSDARFNESAVAANIAFGFNELLRGETPALFDVTEVNPDLGGISREPNGGLDPRPNASSPALSGAATDDNRPAGVEATTYRGAFSNGDNWATGWTAMDEYGYFGDLIEKTVETIRDEDIEAGQTLTLTNDQEYLLDGYVYVEEGAALIIEAGTVIKGKTVPTNGDLTSALIIAKGGQIFAEGTADAPIIFTGELDDLSTTEDITAADNQLWGGIIILGDAPIGEDGGQDVIEGIPSNEPRIVYGGNNPMDNSGILTYVSIRHGGSVLGADNEINGLTCGGVGAGTTIDFVEVFANKDDGIELFGGTVDVKHAVIAFAGDDSFDVDESWDGFGQFIFSIQGEGVGDHGIEYDGSEATDLEPRTTGKIYNGTFIGDPSNSSSDGSRFRQSAAVQVWNSIFTEVAGYAYRFDDDARFDESAVAGNIAFGFNQLLRGNEPALFDVTEVNPDLGGISRMPNGGLDPRPNGSSPALNAALIDDNADEGVENVGYIGAFGNSENWAAGWTAVDEYGYFGDLATGASNIITDATIEAGQTVVLEAGEYILDGFVYVEEGARLFIEAGSVIKGKPVPTTGDQTSALIIAQGGQIFAEGTADAPIIFTSELDDLSTTTDLTAADNSTWGGLLILGNAPIGEDGGTDVIEGIPSDEPRIVYGGNDPMDNSGVLRYVSVRHGGSVLGADNEINGITCGGVGAGTTIDFVEVFANQDDGIELFGGTVNVTHAVIAFAGDDAFDVDESWDGFAQYVFSIQGEGVGDHGIEYDGSEATDQQPKTTGKIYNSTFIGDPANGSTDGSRFRQDAAVQVWNSIFTEVGGYAYRFDDARFEESAVAGNIAFGFGQLLRGNEPGIFDVTEVDPELGGISREPDGGLDPRPDFTSPAFTLALEDENAEEGVEIVDFVGAFDNSNNWADGWTALATYGYFGDLVEEATGADLALEITSDREEVGIFENVTVTVSLTNNGPEIATGVVVDATNPEGTVFSRFSTSTGAYRLVDGQWDAGTIEVGETVTLELVLFTLVRDQRLTVEAAISASDVEDLIDSNNSATLVLNQGGVQAGDEADLELSIEADASRYAIFNNLTYTVTLTNNGPADASGVVVSAGVPAGTAPVAGTASTGTYALFAGNWEVGTIAAGATETLEIVAFTLSDNDPLVNFAQVSASSTPDPDSTPGNDTDGVADEDDEATITVLPASNANAGVESRGTIAVQDMTLYPNPATTQITLRVVTAATTATTAHVFDVTGKVVMEQVLNVVEGYNAIDMNVKALPQGFYYIRIDGVDAALPFHKK